MAKRRWNVIEPEARRLRRAGHSWPEVAEQVSRVAGEKVEASTLRKRLVLGDDMAGPPRADSALTRAEQIVAGARRSPAWADAMQEDGYVGAIARIGTPEQTNAIRVLRIPGELAFALQLVVVEPDDDPADEHLRTVTLRDRALALVDDVRERLEAPLVTEDEVRKLLTEPRKPPPRAARPATKKGSR